MSIEEAIILFAKQFPDRKFKGYWKTEDGFILHAESPYPDSSPAQFVVTNSGEFYATNPMMTDFSRLKYVKYKIRRK